MKRFILSILCVFIFTATSYCQSADSNSNTISDDVWTMTRLIGGEIKKEFSGKYLIGWGNEQRCMGVYLKDYGAVFVTRVQFPIFDYREVKSGKKYEPGDLWEKYKSDSGLPAWGLAGKQDSENRMNKQVDQIKRLERFLVDIICNFAGNLDRIPPDEYITIAVKGNRDVEYPFVTFVSQGDRIDKLKDESVEQSKLSMFSGLDLTIRKSYGEHGRYLIMKIKKKDISGDCSDKIEISFN